MHDRSEAETVVLSTNSFALDVGVRFRDENLVELTGLCNEDTVKQAVLLSKLLLTEESLEALYGNVGDDIIKSMSLKISLVDSGTLKGGITNE